MGRLPKPADVADAFTAHLDRCLADGGLVLTDEQRQLTVLHGHAARDRLVSLTTAMHNAVTPVAEAVASVLVDIGRQIAPPAPVPALRLRRRKNRRTKRKAR